MNNTLDKLAPCLQDFISNKRGDELIPIMIYLNINPIKSKLQIRRDLYANDSDWQLALRNEFKKSFRFHIHHGLKEIKRFTKHECKYSPYFPILYVKMPLLSILELAQNNRFKLIKINKKTK